MGIVVSHRSLSLFWICELCCTAGILCSAALEDYCAELSPKSLSMILGQAYNPRYMSIEPPSGRNGPKEDPTKIGAKRSSIDVPFYADDDVLSLGSFPAWETNHFTYHEKKEEDSLKRKTINVRNVFEGGGPGKHEMFKTRPWECSSIINWIDLGLNYFPRYIRSIECIAKKCWYGHFKCKPKSFTIKVLRRKPGSCIHVSDKLILITSDEFINDYTQLWIWEEIAVNFCCECVMLY
ncbi:protein trunk [Drosophila sulfurigaster albostrigata]|uniref:protein trunk n=1 Tax=Drosophila nasuta TaxID=42062 RepID=UPI00295EB614|nr:protein trunk [Drosophila nasuta]XP_062121263.1 protein trunk [Drosophila sulfurigaster albostrigata]